MSLGSFRFNFPVIAGTVTAAALMLSQADVIAAQSPEKIADFAKQVTVQVNVNPLSGGGGSGVIIKRRGKIYTVLTCIHVVESTSSPAVNSSGLTIRTYNHLRDTVSYPVENIQKLGTQNDSDLALLTFSSSEEYPTAKLTKSDRLGVGAQIFLFGYPALDNKLNSERDSEFSPGFVTSRPIKGPPQYEPYTIRYNAISRGGMSGGPVFDVDGRVVGIHGYGGREKESQNNGITEKTGFNAAVPTSTFLALYSKVGQNVEVDNTPSTDKPTERLNSPKSASDFLAKGLVESDQGKRTQAINSYTQAITINPQSADAYYNRGNARYDKGDQQGAIDDYNRAINLNPKYANAYYNRGVIRYKQGNQQGALEDFSQYIKLSPEDIQGYYNRGSIRRSLKDYQGTFEDFDKVVRLAPDNAKAYFNRGIARSMLRDKEGTLEDFNEALRLDPNWSAAYITRAIFRRRLGDREGAIEDFSKVINLEPKNATAYFNRGLVYRDLSERQKAIEDLHTAVDLFKQQGDTNNYRRALEKIQSIEATPGKPTIEQTVPSDGSSQKTPSTTETQQPTPSDSSDW